MFVDGINLGPPKTNGSYNRLMDVISLNNKLIENRHNIEGTLIHEIQHKIQAIEKFENGANPKLSRLRYYNSLGEIEASNTRERFEQEKYKGYNLDYIAPLSVDKNAKHKDLDNYLKSRKTTDKIKDKLFSKVGEKDVKENQEIMAPDITGDRRLVVGRIEELDNSSFSNEKNTNIAPVKGEVKYSLNENEKTELDGLKALDESGLANKEELSRLRELEKKQKVPERIEKARKNYVENKVEKAIRKQAYKNINIATKTAQNYLEFNNTEKKVFKDSLIDLSTKTKEELKEFIESLDPYEYGKYILVEIKRDRDEIIDEGFIAKSHTMKLKPRKKS